MILSYFSPVTDHPSPITNKAVFFDRDGVINKAIVRDGKAFSPRTLEEFILSDGIREAVAKLKERGYKTIVITNQPELARGLISREILERMTERIKETIPLDDMFICPHDDEHQCSCRKPKPGMLLQAAKKWKLDLASSFFIGDTWKDTEAGKAAHCKTILLDTVYNQEVWCDFRVKSLAEAVSIIMTSAS